MDETTEPEAEHAGAGAEEDDERGSVTELVARLARELGTLAFIDGRAAAARHERELRVAARDLGAAVVAAVAFTAAFVLANQAAVHGLSTAMPDWAAALVLAAAWAAVGVAVALFVLARVRRLTAAAVEDPEATRAAAEQAVRDTLEELARALSREIAAAAVPIASGMASGVAEGVVDVGDDLIEGADDLVESLTEDVPGGGVVNQMWDVVLMPGRLGIRVATTVLRR
jgi:hypothetical protein